MENNEEKAEAVPEFRGRNLEEAIAHAEHKLKTLRQDFNYEIVTEKTKLFGLSKEIVIRAWLKASAEENKVADFLEKLMTVFPLELEYEIKRADGITFVVRTDHPSDAGRAPMRGPPMRGPRSPPFN